MKPQLERGLVADLTLKLDGLADPGTPDELLRLLRLLYTIGRSDLPLGRVFEGHVDALQIISRIGTPEQIQAASDAAYGGAAFGVWNADKPGAPLRWSEGYLDGAKAFASGAGVLSHALASVDIDGGRQLLLLDLAAAPPDIDRTWWRVSGMQRSETHIVHWSKQPVAATAMIGTPGDYVREPWFSGGAIRFAAVQAGGIAAIVDQVRDHLVAQSRAGDPHQSARLAELYLSAQAASDAVAAAARHWQADDISATLAHVASARIAVYDAGERVLTLAQAAVGVQAMFLDHPLASTMADLAVYLRQPGPDAQRARVGKAVADNLLTPSL